MKQQGFCQKRQEKRALFKKHIIVAKHKVYCDSMLSGKLVHNDVLKKPVLVGVWNDVVDAVDLVDVSSITVVVVAVDQEENYGYEFE